MTEEDREQLKAELMKTGFWDEDAGDPTAEEAAATALYHELEYRLGPGAYLNFIYNHQDPEHQELCIRRGDFMYALPEGENRNEAICLAALVLPKFLRLCPEYAAGESLALV